MTASSLPVIGPLPAWDEYERPTLPGSPATLRHSPARRVAYVVVAALVGLTGALGNALVVANIQVIQGQLGLTPMEASWLSVAYATANVTANLLLVRFRQRYGARLFAELCLSAYALLAFLHLFVDGFATAVLVRGASGLVAAATSTLTVLYLLQALPKNRLGEAVVVGLAIPQVATPIAWLLSPQLLDLGDWQTLYQFESGLALCSFAAVVCLKLPVALHVDVMERRDLVTWTLLVPGVGLLVAVLSQGLNAWWLDTAWLGWALIGAIVLIGLAVAYELRREKPLLQIDWLLAPPTLRFAAKLLVMRFLLTEQSYGAVGLMRSLGMGADQLRPLYAVILAGMVCGTAISALTFGPRSMAPQIMASVVLIAVGGFMDHASSSLTRPHDLFASQFLLAVAWTLFVGPILLIGVMQALKQGVDHLVTFIVVFGICQNLGGLLGSSVLGTLQARRTQEYVSAVSSHVDPTRAGVPQRLAQQQRVYVPVMTDPVRSAAEGTAQLAQIVRREAAVRAYNDVFSMVSAMSLVFLVWSLYRALCVQRRARHGAVTATPASAV